MIDKGPIVLEELGPRFGVKHVPGFLYKWVGKLLHVDEINEFVRAHWDDDAKQFMDNLVVRLDLHGNFSGPGYEDILNLKGKQYLVVSNHPIGGSESNLCLDHLLSIDPEVKLLAAEFYSMVKPMNQCCVYNKSQVNSLRDALDDGKPILMYPAGACSRKLSFGDVFDYRWKRGFIKMARRKNMPIIVCFTSGQASNRYLNFTKVRKFFHIKPVIEASFLPDEMFRKIGSTIDFTFGSVIDPSVLTSDVTDQEWADRIRQYCYRLKTNPNAVFDPSVKAELPLE